MEFKIKRAVKYFLGFFLLVLVGMMYFYMLNSKFGYDATVYFIIGEDWTAGTLPYERFIEGKPLGLFFLAKLFISLSKASPYYLNLAILCLNLTLIATALVTFRHWMRSIERWIFAFVFLGLGFLTEMAYFLAEQPLTILALLAFALFWNSVTNRRYSLFEDWVTGLILGIAFLFKQTAVLNLERVVK